MNSQATKRTLQVITALIMAIAVFLPWFSYHASYNVNIEGISAGANTGDVSISGIFLGQNYFILIISVVAIALSFTKIKFTFLAGVINILLGIAGIIWWKSSIPSYSLSVNADGVNADAGITTSFGPYVLIIAAIAFTVVSLLSSNFKLSIPIVNDNPTVSDIKPIVSTTERTPTQVPKKVNYMIPIIILVLLIGGGLTFWLIKGNAFSKGNDAVAINNLDSINYIFTSNPQDIRKSYLNKEVVFTGSIRKGEFQFYKDSKNGFKTSTGYGIETDLKDSALSNLIGIQDATFFYDKSKKKMIEKSPDENYLSTLTLLTEIYDGFAKSTQGRSISKGLDISDVTLKSDALNYYNGLKEQHPDVAASLMKGDIAAFNYYYPEMNLLDFIVVDNVTIQGKVIDIKKNRAGGIWFKLAGTKIINTKRLIDLDKGESFIPKWETAKPAIDSSKANTDSLNTLSN